MGSYEPNALLPRFFPLCQLAIGVYISDKFSPASSSSSVFNADFKS